MEIKRIGGRPHRNTMQENVFTKYRLTLKTNEQEFIGTIREDIRWRESKPLTWQDIKIIVEIVDKMVEKDINGELPSCCDTEEGYYKAVLEKFNKTRK